MEIEIAMDYTKNLTSTSGSSGWNFLLVKDVPTEMLNSQVCNPVPAIFSRCASVIILSNNSFGYITA